MRLGILDYYDIVGVKVEIDLIPTTNKKARPQNPMKATSVTVHETANYAKGADADAHSKYLKNINESKSWHFTVDDKKIIQHLPINENAWAAGDGVNGKGNRSSIHIEICVNEGIDFEKAKNNVVALIRFLKAKLVIVDVFPHRHWTGKNCPTLIIKEGWDKFMKQIEVEVKKDWKQLGLEWLQNPTNVSPPIDKKWKKDSPIDMGTLGEILSRLK